MNASGCSWLALSAALGAEAYAVAAQPAGVVVSGGDVRGVMFGVGKLLRNASFDSGRFVLGSWRGGSAPVAPNGFRAMCNLTNNLLLLLIDVGFF